MEEKEFGRNVQMSCSRLLDSYKTILRRAQISDERSLQKYEELQLDAAVEQIVGFSVLVSFLCI